MILPMLLAACRHNPGYVVTIRPTREVAYLKLRADIASQLYEGLTGEGVVEVCSERGCKRAGEAVICSTMNLRDPVVCELRLEPGGGLMAPRADLRLYHSLRPNRTDGAAMILDDVLHIDGMALMVMGAYVEQDITQLWIQLADPEIGELILMREPPPR